MCLSRLKINSKFCRNISITLALSCWAEVVSRITLAALVGTFMTATLTVRHTCCTRKKTTTTYKCIIKTCIDEKHGWNYGRDIAAFLCSWPHPYSTLIWGCSRCSRSPMLGQCEQGLKLLGRDIIFELLQPMWSRYLNVIDGQTDTTIFIVLSS